MSRCGGERRLFLHRSLALWQGTGGDAGEGAQKLESTHGFSHTYMFAVGRELDGFLGFSSSEWSEEDDRDGALSCGIEDDLSAIRICIGEVEHNGL